MKKRLLLTLIIFIIMITLTGCGASREQKKNQNKILKNALTYYNKKYNSNVKVNKSYYNCYYDGLISTKCSDDYYVELDNGYVIYYNKEKNKFYDNTQSETIERDIKNSIWNEVLKPLEPYKTNANNDVYFNYLSPTNFFTGFFNEYYDGKNIKNYALKEEIKVDYGQKHETSESVRIDSNDIYVIDEDGTTWKNRVQEAEKLFNIYFKDKIYISAITSQRYNEIIDNNYRYLTKISDEGCWGIYNSSNGYKTIKYIKIMDGLYATSDEYNLELEEGDIKFINSISKDELNQKIEAAQRYQAENDETYKKYETNYYKANIIGNTYKIQLSDRIKKAKKNDDDRLLVYFKLNTNELNIENTNNLYKFNDEYHNYKNYVEASGSSQKSDSTAIDIDNSNHYYWIGKLEIENINK